MSDRLAVLDHGKVRQVGAPQRGLQRTREHPCGEVPRHGRPWEAEVVSVGGDTPCCKIGDVDLRVHGEGAKAGDQVSMMVRPERVAVAQTAEGAQGSNVLPARVDTMTFRGARTAVLLDCQGLRLEAEVANIGGEPPAWLAEGADVSVQVSPAALRVLTS